MDRLTARDKRDKLFMLAVFLVLSVSSLLWAHRNRTPPPWDPSDHLRFAYDYYQPLAHFHLRDFYREFFLAEHFYAPLVHLLTACFFLIFGASETSGIMTNLVSLAVLMASVYWMAGYLYDQGKRQSSSETGKDQHAGRTDAPQSKDYGSKGLFFSGGALAAILVSCYHFPAWLLHDAFLDFPLLAAVSGTFALLIRADDFTNRRFALEFGVAAGLGLLVKETFPFFFLLPAVYVVARVLIQRKRVAMFNLVLAALLAAAIASIWYLPHLGDVSKIYQINKQAAVEENEAPLFSFMSNVVYLHGLVSYQIQALFGALFGIGLIYSLARRARQSVMLYLWIASGIAGFTMLANKDMRYTIPILPAVALLSVCWANDFPSRFPLLSAASVGSKAYRLLVQLVKPLQQTWSGEHSRVLKTAGQVITVFLVGFSLVSFINAQWPRPGEGDYIDTPHFRWMIFARNYFLFDHRPLPDDWSVPEIAQTIRRVSEPKAPPNMLATSDNRLVFAPRSAAGGPPTVGVFVNLPYLNPSSIALYGRFESRRKGEPAPYRMEWLVEDERRNLIPKCQYFVVRTGLDRVDWVAPLERYAEQLIRDHPEKYVEIARFPIPDSASQAILYKVVE